MIFLINTITYTAVKMKPINVKSDFYAACNVYSNAKDGRFKIGDHARTSKYNNIFVESYAPNLSEEIFMIC